MTELLAKTDFRKFVVLENFHYLPEPVQRQIAFDLKTFHEVSIKFVILGVWAEADYLVAHNGDLSGRMIEIPVEPWEDADFDAVIANGSEHLNIKINPTVRSQFKENSHGNIGMLQDFLFTFCRKSGITETQDHRVTLKNKNCIEATFATKVRSEKGRLARILHTIAGRSRVRTHAEEPLVLPYFLVKVILEASMDDLRIGFRPLQLLERLQQAHSQEGSRIRSSDVTNLLKRLPSLQEGIEPPFLHFDKHQNRLKIVDATQFFVLSQINRKALLAEIPFPF